MKKKIIVVSLLAIVILILYTIQYTRLEYGIGFRDYLRYSKDFTQEELKILEKYQPLVYGGNINEPPLGVYYEENGQYIGLVVDRINALSIELGVPIISRPMVWNEALDALAKGETNLCDMVPSNERSAFFDFSDPIYLLRAVVVVPNSNKDINRLKDLTNMTVAVQKGDYAIELLSKIDQVRIVETANLEEALDLLNNKQVDAVAGDEPVARYLLNELSYQDNYHILDEYLYVNYCVFAMPKSQEDLLYVINKAIFSMKQKGTMDKIEAKWSRYHTSLLKDAVADKKVYLNLGMLAVMLLITFYLIYLWNRKLKSLAMDKTKELDIVKNELQITFDGMDDFLVVVDQDLRVKNINSPFAAHINMDKSDAIGKIYTSIEMLKELEAKYDGLLLKFLSGVDKQQRTVQNEKYESPEKYELEYNERFYKISLYPLGDGGLEGADILVMISDNTLARIEQQRLLYSNKMETIGQLAAGVAHELRTPLGTIRNSSYLLQREHGEDADVRSIALHSIDSSVERASSIIENLLKFSRLTNEKKEWVDLEKSILESVFPSRMRMDEQGILLDIICEPGTKLYINSESLNHILANLIQNAVDAMPNGGRLTIHCRWNSANKNIIQIQITDEGIGIKKDAIEKLFGPFYTTKAIGKGTGLGLYIAYSEIQKAKGDITVESEAGRGTTFTITIPDGSEHA